VDDAAVPVAEVLLLMHAPDAACIVRVAAAQGSDTLSDDDAVAAADPAAAA
jgi:hypothetical protein